MSVYWRTEVPNQAVSGLGETKIGVMEGRSSLVLESLLLMTATDVVTGIPWDGNRKVWGLADES